MSVLGAIALGAGLPALRPWPAEEPALVEHEHTGLPEGHPHLADAVRVPGGWRHSHRRPADDILHAHA